MSITTKLGKDTYGKDISQTLYHSMIGRLLYLTVSHHDISFSVGVCAIYQSAPKDSHINAIKCIIRYVGGTPGYGLWYPIDTPVDLAIYFDTNWVRNIDDRKNTYGACFYVVNFLVAWMSKKLNFISLSLLRWNILQLTPTALSFSK